MWEVWERVWSGKALRILSKTEYTSLGVGREFPITEQFRWRLGPANLVFPATISFGEWQWFVIFILPVFAVRLESVVGVGNMHSNKPHKLRYNPDKVMVVMISNEFQLYQWLYSHGYIQWLINIHYGWFPMKNLQYLTNAMESRWIEWIPSPWDLKKPPPWPMVP